MQKGRESETEVSTLDSRLLKALDLPPAFTPEPPLRHGAPFYGREDLFQEVVKFAEEDGPPQKALWFEGEAGAGKSSFFYALTSGNSVEVEGVDNDPALVERARGLVLASHVCTCNDTDSLAAEGLVVSLARTLLADPGLAPLFV